MAEPAEATTLSEERAEMREHALLDESMSVLTDSVSSSDEQSIHDDDIAAEEEEEEEEEGEDASPLPGTEAFDAIVHKLLLMQFVSPEESRDSSDVQEAASGDSANYEEEDDDDDEFHVSKIRMAIVDAARRFGSAVILADLEAAILQQTTTTSSRQSPLVVVSSRRCDRKKQLWRRYHHIVHGGLPDGVVNNIKEYLASINVQEEQKLFVEKSQSLLAGEFPGCVEVSGGEESSPVTSREEAEEEEVVVDAAKGSGLVESSSCPSALSTLDHVDASSVTVNLEDPLGFTGEPSPVAAYKSSEATESVAAATAATAADHDGDTTSYATANMFEEDHLVLVYPSQSTSTPDRQFEITAHNGGEFVYETGLEVLEVQHSDDKNQQQQDCINVATTCETPMLVVELRSKFTEEEDEEVFSEADQSLMVNATQDDGINPVDAAQNMLQPLVTTDKDTLATTDKDTLALSQETPESLNGTATDGNFLQLLIDNDNEGAVCSPVVVMKHALDENFLSAIVTLLESDMPSAALDEGVEVDESDYHQHHTDANEKSSVDIQDVVVAQVVSPNEEIADDAQALPGTDGHVKNEQEPAPDSDHVVITELAQEPLLGDVEAQALNESIACSSADNETTPALAGTADDALVRPFAKDEQNLVVEETDLAVKDAHLDAALELPYGGADQDKTEEKGTQHGTDIAPRAALELPYGGADQDKTEEKETQHGTDIAPRLVDEESLFVPGAFDSTDDQRRPIVKDEDKVLVVVVETVDSDSDDEIHPIEQKVVVKAINPFEQHDEGTGHQDPQSGLKGECEHEVSAHDPENVENNDASAAATGDAKQIILSDNKGNDLVAEPNHIGERLDETLCVSIEGDAKLEEPASMVSVDIDPTNELWLGSFSSSRPQVESSSTKDHESVHETGAPATLLGLPLKDDGNFVESETLDVDLTRCSESTNGAWLGSFRNNMPQVNPDEEFVSERLRPDAYFNEISDIDDSAHSSDTEKMMLGVSKQVLSDEQIDPFGKLEDEFLMEIVGPSMENSSFRPLVAEKRDSPAMDYTNQPNTSQAQRVALADLLLLEDTDGPSEGDTQTAKETTLSHPGHTDNAHGPAESPTPDQNKQEVTSEIGSPGSAFEKKYISLPIPDVDGDAAKQDLPFLELPTKKQQEVPEVVNVVNLAITPTTTAVDGQVDPQLSLPEEQVDPAYGQGKSIQTVSETILIEFNEKLACSSQQLLHAAFLNLCCSTASELITDDDDDEIRETSAPMIQPTQKTVNEDKTASRPSSSNEATPREEKACDLPERACDVTPKSLPGDKDDHVTPKSLSGDNDDQELKKAGRASDSAVPVATGLEPDETVKVDDAKVGESPMELAAENVAIVLDTDEILETPIDATSGAGTDPSTETAVDVDKSDQPLGDNNDLQEQVVEAGMEATNETENHENLPLIMEGKENPQEIAEKSPQMDKTSSESIEEKRFILKPTIDDMRHTPVVQPTTDAFDMVNLEPALQQDESANEASPPSATKNTEKPGDSKARITKQYTQCLFQHPLPSGVVIVPSLASTDSDVTSYSDEGGVIQASKKRGVMVDYKNNKYRGFVVVLHERHGVMLMHSSGIPRDEASQHWQLPGGQVHECEFIEAGKESCVTTQNAAIVLSNLLIDTSFCFSSVY
jgi:hypothetical protein